MLDPELEMQVDKLCNFTASEGPQEDDIADLYAWIDSLEFSRPKKNIARDFSDGVLMAELINTYLPAVVDVRNYYAALSTKNKENNWEHLRNRVLNKIGLKIDKQTLRDVMENKPGAIEKVLFFLRPVLARKNRSILNYRRNLIKKPTVEVNKGVAKFLSQTSTSQIKHDDTTRKPRSKRPSTGNRNPFDVVIPQSLLEATVASENRCHSKPKDSPEDHEGSKARVEKLFEERKKSIRAQSRPITRDRKPLSPGKIVNSGAGNKDKVLTSEPIRSKSPTTTKTTSIFLTEEYILSGKHGRTFTSKDKDPLPAIKKNLFGLV